MSKKKTLPRSPVSRLAAGIDLTYGNDDRKLLRATAFHEAGHAVIGYRFGKWIRDGGITVEVDRPGNGHCATRGEIVLPASVWSSEDMKRYQQKRLGTEIMELLAGYLAEGRAMGLRRRLCGGEDWIRCVEHVRYVYKRDQEWAEGFVYLHLAPTARLLRTTAIWAAVEVIANRLILRRTLTGDEAQPLLEGTGLRHVPQSYWRASFLVQRPRLLPILA